MSVPNQKKIHVKRYSDKAQKDYFKISNSNLKSAMYNLKGNAFKLWAYLCDNADGWDIDLYPCDFCRIANVCYDTYKSAFLELLEKGYLLQHKTEKNNFMFFERSKDCKEVPLKDVIVSVNEDEYERMKDDYC